MLGLAAFSAKSPAKLVADEMLGQSAGNLWMYPALNSSSQFICMIDAGSAVPTDNTNTSWDGGCALPGQSCYEVVCPGSAYISTFVDAGNFIDAQAEALSSGQYWYQCFGASPIIAIDGKGAGVVCPVFRKVQR
jgi:hypothetical protein